MCLQTPTAGPGQGTAKESRYRSPAPAYALARSFAVVGSKSLVLRLQKKSRVEKTCRLQRARIHLDRAGVHRCERIVQDQALLGVEDQAVAATKAEHDGSDFVQHGLIDPGAELDEQRGPGFAGRREEIPASRGCGRGLGDHGGTLAWSAAEAECGGRAGSAPAGGGLSRRQSRSPRRPPGDARALRASARPAPPRTGPPGGRMRRRRTPRDRGRSAS